MMIPTAPKESKPNGHNRSIHRSISTAEEIRPPPYKDGPVSITAMTTTNLTPQESTKDAAMFVRRNIPFGVSMVDDDEVVPSSSSILQLGNACASANGSNVSNDSHISYSSVEIESIQESTTTNQSRDQNKRTFKEKYIIPLVNRFSFSPREAPLPESSEQRHVGTVKPPQGSGNHIDNSSSCEKKNNSILRSQRFDAFCCTENVGISGPSLLNTEAIVARSLNISRNSFQSTTHSTNKNHNDGEQLLSFAESVVPGHHTDVFLLERQSIECVFVTDEELTGWAFVTESCTSQVFQCMLRGKMVLVKSFDLHTFFDNKEALQDFEFECQMLSSSKHPNIAHALARSQRGTKSQFVVMEHCLSMGTLATAFDEGSLNYSFLRLLSFAKDLASALCYMHTELNPTGPVIHGDLHPDCIGISKDGHMTLADMGRCKLLLHDESQPLVFGKESTSKCLSRGVPSRTYVAPEIWSGGDITEKVDVYSFSLICWSLVQNREPGPCNMDAKRPGSIDTSTLDLHSNWPCEFSALLLACWSRDATKRPSFKKIVSTLDKILRKPALSSSFSTNKDESSSRRSSRSTPIQSPSTSMKSPRDDGWIPRIGVATQQDDNDDLKPDLPGTPAVLNLTRRSFAEKFSQVVADVLPLLRQRHVHQSSSTTSSSRRSTPVSSPNTANMTRKSMPFVKIPSNDSMSTAPLSTHTLGSSTMPHIIKGTKSLTNI